jgi:3'(2'), 5'-bisphosphate nucleotidase
MANLLLKEGRIQHMNKPAIESILTIIREAGALARTMQRQVILSVKGDGTAVTETDISSHNMIMRGLARITPSIPVISEEQPLEQNAKILAENAVCWVVDPLDVTANYAAGGNAYSINIALMEKGVPVQGALYFPGLEELYYTGDDGKAYKQTGKEPARIIHVAPLPGGTKTAAVRPNEQATHRPVADNTLKIIFTRGQRRACLVATGEATFCSERAGFRIWDSAATYAIVTAAGGKLQKQDGAALRYNEGLELPAYFVGHPDLLGRLHEVAQETGTTPAPHTKRRKA